MIASVLVATQAGFATLLRIFDPSLPLHAEMTTRGFHFTVLRLWAKVPKIHESGGHGNQIAPDLVIVEWSSDAYR